MSPIDDKARRGIEIGGGRHYTGRGLGPEPSWTCSNCEREQFTPVAQGCPQCRAAAAAPAVITATTPVLSAEAAEAANERQGRLVEMGRPGSLRYSPLVTQPPPWAAQHLADIQQIIRQTIVEVGGVILSQDGDSLSVEIPRTAPIDPQLLYAEFTGLQLLLAAMDGGASDPLLPTHDVIRTRIATLEALPAIQDLLLAHPQEI